MVSGLQQQSSQRKRGPGRPFPKGVSGNPSGKRKGAVSIAATLKGLLSKPDAERICRKLIEQAKAGDLQAVKLLLDRMDGPLSGQLAVAVAQAGVQIQAVDVAKVEVRLVDNGRGDSGLRGASQARPMIDISATVQSVPQAKPEPQPCPVEPERVSPVMTAAEFLTPD